MMQFAIVTASISGLAIYFKYIEKSTNDVDYNNLVVLNHAKIVEPFRKKLRLMEVVNVYLVTNVMVFLILTTYMNNNSKNIPICVLMIFGSLFIENILDKYSFESMKNKIHHSVCTDKLRTHAIRGLINLGMPVINSGVLLLVLWSAGNIINNRILCIIVAFVSVIIPAFSCIYKRKLSIEVKEEVVADSNTVVVIHHNNTDEKIDIVKNNISIDRDGTLWIFDRKDINNDISHFKLSGRTYLKIDNIIIKRCSRKSDFRDYRNYI